VVDRSGLENRHTLTGIGGSNPSLSEFILFSSKPREGFAVTPEAAQTKEILMRTALYSERP